MVTMGIFPSKENPHGRTGNRTRDLMISSQKIRPLDHEASQIANCSKFDRNSFHRIEGENLNERTSRLPLYAFDLCIRDRGLTSSSSYIAIGQPWR
jgi:hypothetical protein